MIRLIPWPRSQHKKRRGRPYVYSPTVILRCFVVRIWLRLDSNRSLHEYLAMDYPYNRRVLMACGLTNLPDRRTFDRRLSTISVDIKERISGMGNLFVNERLVDPYIVAIDSTLIRAKGHLWHKSSIIKRIASSSAIDTVARWGIQPHQGHGYLGTNFITASTGSLIVSLSADFTQTDVQDNQIYLQ
jgi:hypothetical protein